MTILNSNTFHEENKTNGVKGTGVVGSKLHKENSPKRMYAVLAFVLNEWPDPAYRELTVIEQPPVQWQCWRHRHQL